MLFFYHMNLKTNIQHTYSVKISDQVPVRTSKARQKSNAEALPGALSTSTEYFEQNGGGAPDDE